MKTDLSSNNNVLEMPLKRGKHYALYVFFVLLAATFLNGVDASEFTGAANVIGRELHLSINDVGALGSAFTIFLTISIIPIGLRADRAKRTSIIAACLTVWSLATALTGLATGFTMLFLTRVFTGIGEAGYAPAGYSLVGDYFKSDQRAKVISWLAVVGVVGPILGSVLGGVIAGLATGSWRYAFFVSGILGLILAFFAWRLHEPARRNTGMLPSAAAHGVLKFQDVLAQLLALLRIKTFVCLLIIGVLTTFTSAALQFYFPLLLQQHDTFGLSSGQAGVYFGTVLGPIALVGVLLGGYLADWLDRRYAGSRLLVVTLSILLTIPLNTIALFMMFTHNLLLFSIVMVPTFFIDTLRIAPLSAAMLDIIPAESRASAIAISTFVGRTLGAATATLLVGTLAGFFDPSGLHFLHGVAGHDIIFALVCTCPLAFILSGITGILGLRWVKNDRAAANEKMAA